MRLVSVDTSARESTQLYEVFNGS